jgi:hypothetical protein
MSSIANRLELCEALLALIAKARTEKGDETLGEAVERAIVDGEFRDLEREILDNPGAIEPWLVRRRREN